MKNSNGKIKITYREALKQGLRKALDEKTFLAWVAKTHRVIRGEKDFMIWMLRYSDYAVLKCLFPALPTWKKYNSVEKRYC